MTAQILNGKEIAAQIRLNLKEKTDRLPAKPHLAIILAGQNEASAIYVRNKQKAAESAGVRTTLYQFASTSSEELISLIKKLNADHDVNGIMVQLPLPYGIDEKAVLRTVNPIKDVDGFHPLNIGLLQNNSEDAMIAATPKGILRLLQETGVKLQGLRALVIGRSQIVGKPAAMLLLNQDCTVTIAHSHSQNLPELVYSSDIVIAACGCPKLIKGEWIKDQAVLIDVGINSIDGKLCGDIDFDAAKEKASFITPVPGGVGPMTIAMLLENTVEAYLKQNAE